MKRDVSKNKSNKKKNLKKKKSFTSFLDSLRNADIFTHVLIIIVLLLALFLMIFFKNQNTNSVYREAKKYKEDEINLRLKHNVYGDHFVNDLGINKDKSNFYFDKITTAYTYEPDYKLKDGGACSDIYCGNSPSAWSYAGVAYDDEIKYCLKNNCLSLKNNALVYDDKDLDLPSKIKDKKIKNISIYPLDSTWLVGFVFLDGGQEKGRAYSFDGKNYRDLDEDNRFPFVSLNDFPGARIGFGGDSDNYLVLYGGYKFLGYQVNNGNKYDISRFVGLRVSNGGFYPQAIKIEREDDTLWYLYSLDETKPRLIKLWQNGSKSIKGSLALGVSLLEEKENANSFLVRKGEGKNDLELILKKNDNYFKKYFIDNGFLQKNKYALLSTNLLKKKGVFHEATFYSVLACGTNTCDNNIPSTDLKFSLLGDGDNYLPLEFNKAMSFPSSSNSLYWQIESGKKRNTKDYSPWIDGVTDVSYSWFE